VPAGPQTLPFAVVPASLRDFREILALERLCFARDPWPWMDVMAALTFPETVRLKAVTTVEPRTNGAVAIGFVIGDRRRSRGLGWVASIGVHPGYQRRGVGAALLAACERALETPRVRLTLRPSNLAARRMYEAAGYVVIDRLPRYYNDGEDGVVMEKVVSDRQPAAAGD